MTTVVPTGNTYDKYASRNPSERRLMPGFFAAPDGKLPSRSSTTVLEVGVGEGEVSARPRLDDAEATIVGVDPARSRPLRRLRDRGVTGLFADIARLPFPGRSFDVVTVHTPFPWTMIGARTR